MDASPISYNGKKLTDEDCVELDKKLFELEPMISEDVFKTYEQLAELYFSKTGDRLPSSSTKNYVDNSAEIEEAPEKF